MLACHPAEPLSVLPKHSYPVGEEGWHPNELITLLRVFHVFYVLQTERSGVVVQPRRQAEAEA